MNDDLRAAAQAAQGSLHGVFHDAIYANGCLRCDLEVLASPDRILALLSERDELRAALEGIIATIVTEINGYPVWNQVGKGQGKAFAKAISEAQAVLERKP